MLKKKTNKQLSNSLFVGPQIIKNGLTTITELELNELHLSCCIASNLSRPILFSETERQELRSLYPDYVLQFDKGYWTNISIVQPTKNVLK